MKVVKGAANCIHEEFTLAKFILSKKTATLSFCHTRTVSVILTITKSADFCCFWPANKHTNTNVTTIMSNKIMSLYIFFCGGNGPKFDTSFILHHGTDSPLNLKSISSDSLPVFSRHPFAPFPVPGDLWQLERAWSNPSPGCGSPQLASATSSQHLTQALFAIISPSPLIYFSSCPTSALSCTSYSLSHSILVSTAAI